MKFEKWALVLVIALGGAISVSAKSPTKVNNEVNPKSVKYTPLTQVKNDDPVFKVLKQNFSSIYAEYGIAKIGEDDITKIYAPSKLYSIEGRCLGGKIYIFSDLDVSVESKDKTKSAGYSGGGSGGYPVAFLKWLEEKKKFEYIASHLLIDLLGFETIGNRSACPRVLGVFHGSEFDRAGNDYGAKWIEIK